MTADDDPGSLVAEFTNCGAKPLEPGRIGDPIILKRYIEIGAKQHPLASCVELVERFESAFRAYRYLKTAKQYGGIQHGQEKPHSLSYQPVTCTSPSSTALVSVASKMQEAEFP